MLQEKPQLKDSKDWKELYASLRRKFGLREEFTEMVMLVLWVGAYLETAEDVVAVSFSLFFHCYFWPR